MSEKHKETIESILNNRPVDEVALNTLVLDYIEASGKRTPTSQELIRIITMIRQGFLNIRYAAEQYAKMLGYDVYTIINLKTNTFLKSYLVNHE